MQFRKSFKFIKWSLALSLLAGGSLLAITPLINTHQIQTISNDDKNTTISTSNGVIKSKNATVVNDLNDLQLANVENSPNISTAIFNNNGVYEYYVWGFNTSGQLGLGHTNVVNTPTKLDLAQFGEFSTIEINIADIVSNMSYAIADTKDGQKLYVWGYNGYGQLGIGNTTSQHTPQLVPANTLNNYDAIESIHVDHYNIFVVIVKNGKQEIYVTGYNSSGQLGDGLTANVSRFKLLASSRLGNYTSIKQLNISDYVAHAIVDTANGLRLYVWGQNGSGQLGLGSNTPTFSSPTLNSNAPFTSANLQHLELSMLNTSYALNRQTNQLYTWGVNSSGETGVNTTGTVSVPTLIPASSLGGGIIESVNTSYSSHAVVKIGNDSRIYVWGQNGSGQLGVNTTTNREAPTLLDMSALGNPTKIKKLSFSGNVSSSFSPIYTSYAIVEKNGRNALYVWGRNNYGQFGDGTATNSSLPKIFELPPNTTLVNANIHNSTFVVVKDANNKLQTYVSGLNGSGQLGISSGTDMNKLQKIFPTAQTSFTPRVFSSTLSVHDALNAIKADTLVNPALTELSKYVDVINFPEHANAWVLDTSTFNHEQGTLNLNINTNVVYVPLNVSPIAPTMPFEIKLSGFRAVKDTDNSSVTPIPTTKTGLTSDKFYQLVCDSAGLVVNRALLSEYIDLASIPMSANLTIEKNAGPQSDYALDFTLATDMVYGNSGMSMQGSKQFKLVFSLPYFDWLPVILGCSAGVVALIIAGVCLFYWKKRKYRLY